MIVNDSPEDIAFRSTACLARLIHAETRIHPMAGDRVARVACAQRGWGGERGRSGRKACRILFRSAVRPGRTTNPFEACSWEMKQNNIGRRHYRQDMTHGRVDLRGCLSASCPLCPLRGFLFALSFAFFSLSLPLPLSLVRPPCLPWAVCFCRGLEMDDHRSPGNPDCLGCKPKENRFLWCAAHQKVNVPTVHNE
jgi:hypothetical protein